MSTLVKIPHCWKSQSHVAAHIERNGFVLMQLAKMVQKHFQDLEQKELKAEKEEGMKLKRIAGQMAKMIKEFWSNIEKVVT